TEMIMTVADNGNLVHNYYGKKFKNALPYQTKKYREQPDNGAGFAPQAFPAYGGYVTISPALKLIHSDGSHTTHLKYVSHSVTQPQDDVTRTKIVLNDPLYDIDLTLTFDAYGKENVITQSATLTNKEEGRLTVENLASTYLPLHADSYYLTHFHGVWATEMQLVEEQLQPGIKSVESKRGVQATQTANPAFLLSLNDPAHEDHGDVYGGALAWSGNYKLTFEQDECGRMNVIGGVNDFASTYYLDNGQSLTTPDMVWTFSDRGRGQVSRNLHDWIRNHSLAHPDMERPVVLNSWEGAYMNFDEKTITDMIDDAAKIGVEMFVLDDGWFGNGEYARNTDHAGLGDWQVNTEKLPRGIDYLAKHAVKNGLKFGIWIEPEMVNPKSRLAETHPEWIVKSGDRDKLQIRQQWILDLTNPEVQDFIVKTFDDVLTLSPDISYIKWDANRFVTDFGSEHLPSDRQSHFWIDYTKGLYSVYDRIRETHPDVMIQLCSSGGARLDMGALKYHDEFWTSDNTNSLDRIRIQNSTNLFYPAIATASHVSTSPNHQTGMMAPLKYRFDVAMSGRLGLELQPKHLNEEEWEFAKNAIASYKKIRPIVQFGDLYRLKNPEDGSGWASHQYVSKDGKQSVFFAYSMKYHGRTTFFQTRLKGLDPDKQYRITEINKAGWPSFYGDGQVFPGDYLMNEGISLNGGNNFDSTVLHIEEI
ncbi:MAG: alpha-galactosidase, partial [Muribaculaceae bacterium]|nr:alpha-galactosidase [Muribaculaceae bacterium]